MLPAYAIDLPDIGASSDTILSPHDAQRLGQEFMRNVRKHLTLVDDPEITGYLQNLGDRLVQHSTNAGQRFTFFLIKDKTINAFAAPGGFIGVHSGLFIASQSESELAGVLAHEISHITQNHLSRSIESARKLNIPMAMALLAALLLGGNNPDLGLAALTTMTAANTQYQINFTRAHEKEADSIGIELLAKSGFNPYGMMSFFTRMNHASQYYGQGAPEFLRTHPVTTNRMADAQARAASYPYKQIADSTSYKLMHAKLRSLLYTQPDQAIQDFQQSLKTKQYRDQDAEQYGYAFSLYQAQKLDEARRQIAALRKKIPNQMVFINLAAQIEQADNHLQQAKTIYQKALSLYPKNAVLTQAYIDTLLLNHEADQAYQLALELNHRYHTPRLYKQLIKASDALKKTAQAHAYQAEYYTMQNDLLGAINQLKMALKQPNITIHQTIRWQARMKTLQQQWQQSQHAKKKNNL